MLTETHKQYLKDFIKKELKENCDLFDIEANIDNNISYMENKNQLIEKIQEVRDNMKEQVKEISGEKYDKMKIEFIENNYKISIPKLLSKPAIMGIMGDANCGKSNLIYYLLTELQKDFSFNLYTYGLKKSVNDIKINSIEELEKIRGSVIVLDEFFNLFDLEDRKKRKLIEKTLRLIYHNNNVLILSGVPENFKKYISAKLSIFIYGKSTLADFVNGSKVKETCLSYKGVELGSSLLDLDKDKFLVFDGNHYKLLPIKYLKEYDTKQGNPDILQKSTKKSAKNAEKIEINNYTHSNREDKTALYIK